MPLGVTIGVDGAEGAGSRQARLTGPSSRVDAGGRERPLSGLTAHHGWVRVLHFGHAAALSYLTTSTSTSRRSARIANEEPVNSPLQVIATLRGARFVAVGGLVTRTSASGFDDRGAI
jgi:hypothetical protein